MMELGFVTAILADYSLEEVMKFAADNGFQCIEGFLRINLGLL